MKTKSGLIKKKERILCPQCLDPINIKINNLMISNGYNIEQKDTDIIDFTKLSCKKCFLEFTFILCAFCEKKIYMKMFLKNLITLFIFYYYYFFMATLFIHFYF